MRRRVHANARSRAHKSWLSSFIKLSTQRDTESFQESSWYLYHSKASLSILFSQPSRRALYLRANKFDFSFGFRHLSPSSTMASSACPSAPADAAWQQSRQMATKAPHVQFGDRKSFTMSFQNMIAEFMQAWCLEDTKEVLVLHELFGPKIRHSRLSQIGV